MLIPAVRPLGNRAWNREYTGPGLRRPGLLAAGAAFRNKFNYAFYLPGSRRTPLDKAVGEAKVGDV